MKNQPSGTPLDPKAQKRFTYGCVGLVLGTCLIILLPLILIRRPDPKLANMRACALASLLYSQDHDEKLPIAGKWMDLLQHKYIKPTAFHSVGLADPNGFGIAFRRSLSSISVTSIVQPESTALVFDSSDTAWNANGELDLLPQPERTPEGDGVATVDGHVRYVKSGNHGLR